MIEATCSSVYLIFEVEQCENAYIANFVYCVTPQLIPWFDNHLAVMIKIHFVCGRFPTEIQRISSLDPHHGKQREIKF